MCVLQPQRTYVGVHYIYCNYVRVGEVTPATQATKLKYTRETRESCKPPPPSLAAPLILLLRLLLLVVTLAR